MPFRMYMLCANHGSGQSMDCAAQSMDPCFARAIHGLHSTCAIHGLRNHTCVKLSCKRRKGAKWSVERRERKSLLIFRLAKTEASKFWVKSCGFRLLDYRPCAALRLRNLMCLSAKKTAWSWKSQAVFHWMVCSVFVWHTMFSSENCNELSLLIRQAVILAILNWEEPRDTIYRRCYRGLLLLVWSLHACSAKLLQPELKTHTTIFISCNSTLLPQYTYLLARIL